VSLDGERRLFLSLLKECEREGERFIALMKARAAQKKTKLRHDPKIYNAQVVALRHRLGLHGYRTIDLKGRRRIINQRLHKEQLPPESTLLLQLTVDAIAQELELRWAAIRAPTHKRFTNATTTCIQEKLKRKGTEQWKGQPNGRGRKILG
jgi:hypothetical protein